MPTRRRVAGEVGVVHADQRAHLARAARTPPRPRAPAPTDGSLTVVDAAAGQRPPARVGGPRPRGGSAGPAGRRRPRSTTAYAATRCSRKGRWSASASVTSAATGTAPETTSSSGFQAASTGGPVDLHDAGCRRVRRHPAVVHDADGVGVDELAVARRARQVGAVDAGRLADGRRRGRSPRGSRGSPPSAGPRRGRARRPEGSTARCARSAARAGSGGPRPGRRAREHDGVRRHALAPRKGSHAPNLVKYGDRRVPRVPRSVARQRQDGAGHPGRRRARHRAGRGHPGQPLGLRLHLPVAHPGVRLRQRLPVEVVRVGPAPDEEPGLHPCHPLPALRAGALLLPASWSTRA